MFTWQDGERLGLGCALPPAPVDRPLLCKMEGGSGHRLLATLEETLVQRGTQSVVQPLLSPSREWSVWEMALQGVGVGRGAFTGPPGSPAPSSCIQSVTGAPFPSPLVTVGNRGLRPLTVC